MRVIRIIVTREKTMFPLTDAFIDANSLETIEGIDEISDNFELASWGFESLRVRKRTPQTARCPYQCYDISKKSPCHVCTNT
jgi:hypothetical protein